MIEKINNIIEITIVKTIFTKKFMQFHDFAVINLKKAIKSNHISIKWYKKYILNCQIYHIIIMNEKESAWDIQLESHAPSLVRVEF